MTDAPDTELLAQFTRENSETAFAALVERHIGLVHSVALRHTTQPQHAQDITQAVFIILAKKADELPKHAVLPGWLYHTARLTAANFQRTEARRIRREQEAYMQSTPEETAPDNLWREMSPLLDEAISHLGATDRDALVLRYFQNKTLPEVGAALGLEERAAQKRVTRAVEKLRKIFIKRGVMLTATAIAGAVSTNSVQAAPAGLVKTISAVAAAKGAAATASTLTLVKGALKLMVWTKTQTAIVAGVGVLLAVTTIMATIKEIKTHRDNKPGQQVAGTWTREGPGTLAITPDGSFLSTFPMPDHTNIFIGTWQIADSFFIMTLTNASVPQARNLQTRKLIGGVERYRIVRVDDHKFVYEENGQIHTLNR